MMETPQLDLTSELLGVSVFNSGGGGTSESAEESNDMRYENLSELKLRSSNYFSNPRKVKVGLGKHRRIVTKRTRLPLKWNRVCSFNDAKEAETFIQTFEGYNWRKGCNNKTSYGLKAYYICKENPACKVMSLLHYDNKAKQIDVYRSDRQHYHGLSLRNGTSSSSNAAPAPIIPNIGKLKSEERGNVSSASNTQNENNITPAAANDKHLHTGRSTNGRTTIGNGIASESGVAGDNSMRKAAGGRRRGLSDETINIINELFSLDPHVKPSQVQEQLKRNGIPLLQNYHINNFLVKLRKQSRESSGSSFRRSSLLRSSTRPQQKIVPSYNDGEYFEDDQDDADNGHEEYYSDDGNNSSHTDTWFGNPNPMSVVDINFKNPFASDENDADNMEEDDLIKSSRDELFDDTAVQPNIDDDCIKDPLSNLDEVSVTITTTASSPVRPKISVPVLTSSPRRASTNSATSPGAVPSTTCTSISTNGVRNNQSEVVSTSNTSRSRKRNFYFRDETTKDGDDVQPNEDNIKNLIVQHIQDNYSNRDLLHIREELQTLKEMKKFRALNRLISFSAGFLQDAFIDATTSSGSNADTSSPQSK